MVGLYLNNKALCWSSLSKYVLTEIQKICNYVKPYLIKSLLYMLPSGNIPAVVTWLFTISFRARTDP